MTGKAYTEDLDDVLYRLYKTGEHVLLQKIMEVHSVEW